MEHDRNNLPVSGNHHLVRRFPCDVQSHDACDPAVCEVRKCLELAEYVTERQVRIGYFTAVCGLVTSGVFALAVLQVWYQHAIAGEAMPAIPLLITSIAGAPFAAGVITTLRIPKKARVKLEQK